MRLRFLVSRRKAYFLFVMATIVVVILLNLIRFTKLVSIIEHPRDFRVRSINESNNELHSNLPRDASPLKPKGDVNWPNAEHLNTSFYAVRNQHLASREERIQTKNDVFQGINVSDFDVKTTKFDETNAIVKETKVIVKTTKSLGEQNTTKQMKNPKPGIEAGERINTDDAISCGNTSQFLVGRFQPTLKAMDPSQLTSLFPSLQKGGTFQPSTCRPGEKTAILIPYRDRWSHLHTLLPVLIPMLMRQNVAFTIYVIEQGPSGKFNKGLLFNAGYLEALKVDTYDCFILHDVDMVPVDDRNVYRCDPEGPLHFSASVDKFGYNTMYRGLFGGVVGFTRDQFRRINGASNMYFGWGAEDDDLRDRTASKNYTVMRKPPNIGVYDMIKHGRQKGWEINKDRFLVFKLRLQRQDVDGLNSVRYTRTGVRSLPLYTWISLSVNETEVLESVPVDLRQGSKGELNYRGNVAVKIKQ